MMVYLVVGVSYDGNAVLAIFSSQERADMYAKATYKKMVEKGRAKQVSVLYDQIIVEEHEIDKV